MLGVEYASFDSTRTDLSINSRDVIIAEQWLVLGRIGEGSFGEVFEAEDVDTFRHYAIKREPLKMRHPQLKHESIMYDVLAGGPGIPQCHWHGQHDGFDCIVIDLLGPNLNQLKQTIQTFPLDVVVDFGCQIVSILEHIHKSGLVYRDIKPDNFLFPSHCHLPEAEMIEIPDDNGMPHIKYINPTCKEVFKKWNEPHPKLHIVDFGLTTWWRNPTTEKPYPETKRNIKNKTGTARYASLNVHRGKPHSRRDDIESLGYLLLDLLFGTLPWTGIQARNSRVGWDRMRQIKEDTFMEDLCAGLPQGFLEFIQYARKLKFLEEPNYDLLRRFLQGSLEGGRYSIVVKSPFGGHTERKWQQDIEKNPVDHIIRPYSNMHGQHYYEPPPPTHQTTNNKQRQRRASYNSPRFNNNDNTDIFAMDDIANNLPHDIKPINKNRNNYRRSSRDLTAYTPGPSSSFQKLVAKNKRKQKRIGWNSHKHDDMPWNPDIDWDTNADTPNINITHASWGEDKPDPAWGVAAWTVKEEKEEEEDSWASKVTKP
ncbi:kinase-like domain-containing protein [Cokeromyces recurvatus]|uniref:kinase-like domain-containing protein n=1 Tax=Cokeromyces recurvatus TaxID=90255 RepID=UPI00221FE40B|nr:kinase-like domain-containing protein [Cokeromyces recurvatus]KAI7906580.1 kinase-like domain-containing protein [Cokeromyces recurvatus]